MRTPDLIKVIFLLSIVAYALQGCSKDSAEISYDLKGDWKVVYFMEGTEKISKTDENTWPDVNNGNITANFSGPDGEGKGMVTGITVTNSYFGDYKITGTGKISISTVGTTFVNEPEWTGYYRIGSAESFEVVNSRLFIYYNNKNNVIAFDPN